MYVEKVKNRQGDRVYEQVLVRENFRQNIDGVSKVLHRTLMNITKCSKAEQDALKLALKYPEKILEAVALMGQGTIKLIEGKSIGAVWVVSRVAQQMGITQALGNSGRQAQLALWQIVARVIDQGSRLSAVRLHETQALAEVIGLESGFNEDNLYDNLAWLSDHQQVIEQRLFKLRHSGTKPTLLLYDVTSSYLEGTMNALGAFGYNRDGKKGKKQIVVGYLCDEKGEPIAVEVFTGNTQDPKTVASQIKKTVERFGCTDVTFVGDRGMIKSAQQVDLNEVGFHYITALTSSQIRKLINDDVLQLDLFDNQICEIEDGDQRLILRRNPVRAQEISRSRKRKQESLQKFIDTKNTYLAEHSGAHIEVAERLINEKTCKLKINSWIQLKVDGRSFRIEPDEIALAEETMLDGCYVIVTDLAKSRIDAEAIHQRYKDLSKVERAFRMSKTGHLELRPIHVRTEKSTRGHVFVVMLAYMIRRELERAWESFNLTVEEGINSLKTLCTMTLESGDSSVLRIPRPRENSQRLFDALGVTIPSAITENDLPVATKKTLAKRKLSTK
jgi:transposase